ncbi:PDZ domain-containing protein [Komagataeibacter rhaeticus]|nr:PDZ domain-containing protein [Komagataeibacter rhaeticus]
MDHHAIMITAVNANGPAWPTTLAAGQIVRAINGRSTESRSLDTVNAWLNGPVGSLVRITVEARGGRRPLPCTVPPPRPRRCSPIPAASMWCCTSPLSPPTRPRR